jgi:arylsulfatase A-like enzyme
MRRVALKVVLVMAVAGGGPATPADAADRPPNVLVVMTDDQRADDMVALPKTRRLLGSGGTTFRNSYVSYSLCCPSRTTFLTGQYSHNHGVTWNFAPYGGYERFKKRGIKNALPVWLQRAGYRTGLIGKFLNEYGEKNPREIPPGWDDWQASVDPSTYHYYGYTLNDNGRLVTYGSAPKDYMTDVYAGRADRFIRSNGGRRKPWFLWLTPNAPHTVSDTGRAEGGPPVPAPRHASLYANATMPRSPSFDEADMSDKPALLRGIPALSMTQIARADAFYRGRLGSLAAVDDMVERLVGTLRSTGQLDNTLILFTSDNGWLIGEHRIVGQKYVGFEESIRVPLYVRGPGFPRGKTIDDPALNVDLNPTIVRAAQATAGRPADGYSLQRLVRSPGAMRDRDLVIETGPNPGLPYYTGVHTRRYQFERITTGELELYDLDRDPYELQNVAGDPAYAGVVEVLSRRLDKLAVCKGSSCHSHGGSPAPAAGGTP